MNNPRAFPGEDEEKYYHGMTLRDYFAAKALEGMNANPEMMQHVTSSANELLGETHFLRMATVSYAQADAMLKIREKDIEEKK